MKIKTERFKELLTLSIQGAGIDKLIPITQIVGISAEGSDIILTTTDAKTYLYVFGECEDETTTFSVSAYIESLQKLVSKITSEYISLNVVNGTLEVKGNGTYTFELPVDENGELITYPDPYSKYKKAKMSKDKISIGDIDAIIDTLKASLFVVTGTTNERPVIADYYVGDKVIATNRETISSFNKSIFKNGLLIDRRLMDELGLMQKDIKYYIDDDVLLFESDGFVIYSMRTDDTSNYPIDIVDNLLSTDYASICKVDKDKFIALLERIALFVGKYDDRAVKLCFEKSGIRVFNQNMKSNEVIDYIDSKGYGEYECSIGVDILLAQLKAYPDNAVEIHYNSDATIKFVSDDITQIVALMAE
jgi:DNA polymerase III sliding clamp (beta) subunit (PCNA family)